MLVLSLLILVCGTAVMVASQPASPDGVALPGVSGMSDQDGPPAIPFLLVRTAIGFTLLIAGLGCLVIAGAFWRPSGPTLAAFGVFASLYGAVILLSLPPIGAQTGWSRDTLVFAASAMSYLLPIPALIYIERVHGPGWLSLVRRLWQIGIVIVTAELLVDFISGIPRTSWPVHRVFLIVTWLVLIPNALVWRQPDRIEGLVRQVATVIFGLTILHDIAIGMGFLPWGMTIGVFGIGTFIVALGFVTVRGAFADQRELAAVEHEMATARTIQQSILPHDVPEVRGLELAARYAPVRSVAGDLYDFVRLDDARIGVLVADVAGHGLSAALIASMAKVAFASQRAYADDPSRVLAEINRVLCGYFDARYVTAAYVFIDTSRSRLRYSLAGHPPPLLWKATDRQVVELREAGLVLGLFESATYPSQEVVFDPGDRLVLYTDGLSEAANASGKFFGDGALADFVSSHGSLAADGFAEQLLSSVRHWTNGSAPAQFSDDLTLVAIRRTLN